MNLKDELCEACREILGGYRAAFKDWSSPMPHAQFLELLEFGRRVGLFDEPEVTVSISPASLSAAMSSLNSAVASAPDVDVDQFVASEERGSGDSRTKHFSMPPNFVAYADSSGALNLWHTATASPELIAHQLLERMKADPSQREYYVAQHDAGGSLTDIQRETLDLYRNASRLDVAPSDAQPIVEADLTVTVSSGPRRPSHGHNDQKFRLEYIGQYQKNSLICDAWIQRDRVTSIETKVPYVLVGALGETSWLRYSPEAIGWTKLP